MPKTVNIHETNGRSVTEALPEPLLIEMGIGWTRSPKDRSKLTSACPRDYVAEIERLRNWRPIDTAPKGGWLHGQATHWMPLPEPPKELL